MDIALEPLGPGRYVVAVSGGVDSMALLHLLQQQPGLQLTVAHFDHGIRLDSEMDRFFVSDQARAYRLPYVYARGDLGPSASEDVARRARYQFLHQVRRAVEADGRTAKAGARNACSGRENRANDGGRIARQSALPLTG